MTTTMTGAKRNPGIPAVASAGRCTEREDADSSSTETGELFAWSDSKERFAKIVAFSDPTQGPQYCL
jgi:hypothetical protein